jgi:hypothetical protein
LGWIENPDGFPFQETKKLVGKTQKKEELFFGGGPYRFSGTNVAFFSMRITLSKIYSIHGRKA